MDIQKERDLGKIELRRYLVECSRTNVFHNIQKHDAQVLFPIEYKFLVSEWKTARHWFNESPFNSYVKRFVSKDLLPDEFALSCVIFASLWKCVTADRKLRLRSIVEKHQTHLLAKLRKYNLVGKKMFWETFFQLLPVACANPFEINVFCVTESLEYTARSPLHAFFSAEFGLRVFVKPNFKTYKLFPFSRPSFLNLLCAFLALGFNGSILNPSLSSKEELFYQMMSTQLSFYMALKEQVDSRAGEIIYQAGVKLRNTDIIQERVRLPSDFFDKMNAKFNQPLTLQRLAANVIRTSLQPNTALGLPRLELPPRFDKTYITLGISKENAHESFTK